MKLDSLRKGLNFLILGALLLGSLYGIRIGKDVTMYRKIGRFSLRPYKYGVYLTQPDTSIFYNVSPYDSYYINETREKEYLISFDNGNHSEETNLHNKKLLAIKTAILSYFSLIDPTATFIAKSNTTQITTNTEGNKIVIYTQQEQIRENQLVITLSFTEEDFVFDQMGNNYTNQEIQKIRDLNSRFGTIIKEPSRNTKIGKTPYIYIYNPKLNGVIRLATTNNSYTIENIDLKNNVVEFYIKNNKQAEIEMELFDSLLEGLIAL